MYATVLAAGEGVYAAALIGLLTAIGGGAWKLLSDTDARVDAAGKEVRDRLEAEIVRLRADLDTARTDLTASQAAVAGARDEADRWRARYYDCVEGDQP